MSSLRQINLKGFDYGNKLLHRYSRQSCPERNCSRKRELLKLRGFFWKPLNVERELLKKLSKFLPAD